MNYTFILSRLRGQAIPQDPDPGAEAYTEQQLLALNALITLVRSEVPTLQYLTTHVVIQPWNRSDPFRIDAKEVAERHGLSWWKPTAAEIAKHKPK